MHNIAANHYVAGMDGIRHIRRPTQMEQSLKTFVQDSLANIREDYKDDIIKRHHSAIKILKYCLLLKRLLKRFSE